MPALSGGLNKRMHVKPLAHALTHLKCTGLLRSNVIPILPLMLTPGNQVHPGPAHLVQTDSFLLASLPA